MEEGVVSPPDYTMVLKGPYLEQLTGNCIFPKLIYCAVLIPPVSIGLKKTVSKLSYSGGSFRNNFLL